MIDGPYRGRDAIAESIFVAALLIDIQATLP